MIVFPVIATGVSAAFAIALLRRFSRRHRLSELAWGVALAMFAVASLAVAGGVGQGWDPTLYRIFWLFGALLNVPWLALGSIALVSRPGAVGGLVVVGVASLYALAVTATAEVSRAGLATEEIPRGRDVWAGGDGMVALARWYSIVGWLVVVGIAAYSSSRRGGMRPPPARVRANWLIALGTSIVAVGGFALSRVGRGGPFSISLALGVVVMFAGFLMASRPGRPAAPPAEARIVLYSKDACSLCEDAKAMLDAIGEPYEIAEREEYRLRVPVIEVDGRIVTEGRVAERAVRAALRRRWWRR